MAEFTHLDLRKARETRFSSRWQLAEKIGVSPDTVERWETGKQKPTPEDVDHIEEATGVKGIWHAWMCSNCDSYRKRYQNMRQNNLLASIVSVRHEMGDVMKLLDVVERAAISGDINDPSLCKQFRKDLVEAVAAASDALSKLPND